MNRKNIVTNIFAVVIGTALFFVLGRYVVIPSPVPETSICIQYGLLVLFATMFGPITGMVIAFFGHMLTDLSAGSFWWSWIIASAVAGHAMGMGTRDIDLENGSFGKKEIIRLNVTQAVAHTLAWIVVAPILDTLFYSEPLDVVFLQGFTAAIVNIITTGVVGTLLTLTYTSSRPAGEKP